MKIPNIEQTSEVLKFINTFLTTFFESVELQGNVVPLAVINGCCTNGITSVNFGAQLSCALNPKAVFLAGYIAAIIHNVLCGTCGFYPSFNSSVGGAGNAFVVIGENVIAAVKIKLGRTCANNACP